MGGVTPAGPHPRPSGTCGGRRSGARRAPRAGAGAARRRCRSRRGRRPGRRAGRWSPAAGGPLDPLLGQPLLRAHADLVAEPAGERPHAHRGLAAPGRPGRAARRGGSSAQSGRGRRSRPRRRGDRAVDELGLAAVAVRRHDAAPGDAVGDVGAVVAADDVQAQVDAGGGAGRGEHVAVVDEEHVGVDGRPRGSGAGSRSACVQCVVARPAVEQPGRGQHVGAGADGHDPRAGPHAARTAVDRSGSAVAGRRVRPNGGTTSVSAASERLRRAGRGRRSRRPVADRRAVEGAGRRPRRAARRRRRAARRSGTGCSARTDTPAGGRGRRPGDAEAPWPDPCTCWRVGHSCGPPGPAQSAHGSTEDRIRLLPHRRADRARPGRAGRTGGRGHRVDGDAAARSRHADPRRRRAGPHRADRGRHLDRAGVHPPPADPRRAGDHPRRAGARAVPAGRGHREPRGRGPRVRRRGRTAGAPDPGVRADRRGGARHRRGARGRRVLRRRRGAPARRAGRGRPGRARAADVRAAGAVADAAMSWNVPVAHLDAIARPALARGGGRGPAGAAADHPRRGGRGIGPGRGSRGRPGSLVGFGRARSTGRCSRPRACRSRTAR